MIYFFSCISLTISCCHFPAPVEQEVAQSHEPAATEKTGKCTYYCFRFFF